MCLPALGPAATGIITAATSAMSTIAGFAAQQQQTAFANAQAQQQYQAQMAAHAHSEQAFNEQMRLNQEAASRAYVAEQERLKFEQQSAALEAQKLLISSTQAQGKIAASGRTGQSIGLLMSDVDREMGRDLAVLGLSLSNAHQDYFTNTEAIFNQAQSTINQAQSSRMLRPSEPLRAPGPSPFGLLAGIGGAAMSGVSAASSLRAPNATQPSAPLSPGWPALQPLPPLPR